MAGFKFNLSANNEQINLNTEVRIEKMKAENLSKDLIKFKHKDGGGVKYTSILDGKPVRTNRGWINEEGMIVDKEEVVSYIEKEGKIIEVGRCPRTKTIEIQGYIERKDISQFLVEGVYEMYSEQNKALWNLANYLNNNKLMGLTKFSFGNGFTEYLALIYPIFKEGKFVLVMALSKSKLEYKHLMDLKEMKEKKELPTLSEALFSEQIGIMLETKENKKKKKGD